MKNLLQAIRDSDFNGFERLLDARPGLIPERDGLGRTALFEVCESLTSGRSIPLIPGTREQMAMAERLLALGADPTSADSTGWTPLHTAAWSGHLALCELLVGAGADVDANAHGIVGARPLAYALFYANPEVGAVVAGDGALSLREAAGLGRLDALPGAVNKGLDFYRPSDGFPVWERSGSPQEVRDEALGWASRCGQLDSMGWLVDAGAGINANPYRGTALLWAAYAGRLDAIRWLVEHGAEPNLKHCFGGSGHGEGACALHLAAQFGALAVVKLLVELGADPNIQDDTHGGSAVDWAAVSDQADVARFLESLG